jgi:hypothetical protein
MRDKLSLTITCGGSTCGKEGTLEVGVGVCPLAASVPRKWFDNYTLSSSSPMVLTVENLDPGSYCVESVLDAPGGDVVSGHMVPPVQLSAGQDAQLTVTLDTTL